MDGCLHAQNMADHGRPGPKKNGVTGYWGHAIFQERSVFHPFFTLTLPSFFLIFGNFNLGTETLM